MNFGYKWARIFRKPVEFKNLQGVKLKHAFTIDGQEFFEPEDPMNLPFNRGLAVIEAYNQLKLGVFPEDIQYVSDEVDKMYERQKFTVMDMVEIKKYINRLKDRSNSNFRHPDLMYNLASVTFIDDTESPFIYDAVYAQKKIDFWKKHKKVTDFFLQMPLQRLIPYLPASEENSRYYLTLREELKKEGNILNKAFTSFSDKLKKTLPSSQSKPSARGTERKSH